MTQIKDIFQKDINRDIRGVIKIGQDSEAIKKQELEEYVVTNELKNNFTRFFDAYDKSINNPTDEMGAWISGFFGSGKSHFLKILSYLLENDTVAGRKAIDYFLEDGKFDDDHLADSINKATSVPTDVALFNIDSKADSNAANDSNAILNVFLKVFNEQLGYSPIAEIADMERWLDNAGKYEAFKEAFQKLDIKHNSTWEATRRNYAIMTTRIQSALINSGALNEVDAKNYVDGLQSKKFSIDAIGFASLVKDYLDKKGNDHHFVFLADEVGQFIGDDDNRMLNLQTIVEQLGVQCQGRAWVVVTSQQQMDEVTGNFSKHERDFSKIQGRFNTLITMSSANADEVIRKRLLAKTPLAKEELEDLFTQKEYSINNKINFSDAIKREKYESAQSFVDNYPFVPYQFGLLKDVLSAVRKKGANGSHMSDGERSMLATFQEATRRYENDNLGKLVPFSAFFIGMKEFLSHDHQVVFDKAIGDKYVNGDHGDYGFNIQVLAVLFMVRYVDNYPSTLENIVTLLLDDINEDRQALTAKVKDALHVLLRQNYIQKKMDTYEFLTDSEQEVNEAINAIEVDDRRVARDIGAYLFTSGLIDSKYTYPKMKNQYIFEFNMYIDDMGLNPLRNDLNIQIVSPLLEGSYRDIDFKQQASDGKHIIIVLKDDDRYIENYRRIEKITTYLQTPESRSDDKKQEIALNRRAEAKQAEESTQKMLRDDLIDADIYVLDDVLAKGSNFEARLEQAKKEIIDNSYRNLQYLTSIKSDQDVLDILKGKSDVTLFKENEHAVDEVVNYIGVQAGSMNNVSFASVVSHFNNIPYGYKQIDVAWMIAKAFADGRLKLYFNNSQISLNDAHQDPKSVQRYFISKNNISKLTIKPVREISMREKRDAREFVSDVLEAQLNLPEDATSEQMADEIQKKTAVAVNILENLLKTQKYNFNTPYPGSELLQKGINKLNRITKVDDSDRVFQVISDHLDDFEDWRDDIDDRSILQFYGDVEGQSSQERIWNRSHDYLDRFNHAKGFINDNDLKDIANDLDKYLAMDEFNKSIPKLSELNSAFAERYNDDMQKAYDDIDAQIKENTQLLKQQVTETSFPEKETRLLNDEIDNKFDSLLAQAQGYSESNDGDAYLNLIGLTNKIDGINRELKERISEVSRELAERPTQNTQPIPAKPAQNDEDTKPSVTPIAPQPTEPIVKPKRTIFRNINDLVTEGSWKIESEKDIDKYLEQLRSKLEAELKNTDILNVDFK